MASAATEQPPIADRPTDWESVVARYCRNVVAGRIVAGRLVRDAVRRHLRDLRNGHRRGLVFDQAAASRACAFFGFLRHSKGEWAGQPFQLEPWQAFTVSSIFGWQHQATGRRRFTTAYIEVARKNGKSTFAAGIGLYMLIGDGEPGADIYTAATKRDQARIIHGEAVRMVNKSPDLQQLLDVYRDNINCPATESKYEPLGADSKTADGLNPHCALVDELHAHPSGMLWDVLDTAMGARSQPLLIALTTAGHDRTSVCWEQREVALAAMQAKTARAVGWDDAYFAFVACIDSGDDWTDEANWPKANPCLGVSKSWDYLRNQFRKAKSPRAQNAFRRLHLDEWTQQNSRWLDMDSWRRSAGGIDLRSLEKQEACGGLDLASRLDFTCWALVFRRGDHFEIVPHFWLPETRAIEAEQNDRIPCQAWARAGLLTIVPGETVDYGFVEDRIQRDFARYQIRQVAYDPWNCQGTASNLAGYGVQMVEFPQTIRNFNEPSQEFERLIIQGKMHHGGNPILEWMAGNVCAYTDPSGNIRPTKPKHGDSNKIDGIVATIMALHGWLGANDGSSIYDRREPLEFDL